MCSVLDRQSQREFVRWMTRRGYEVVRHKGGHTIYRNAEINHSVVVSVYLNRMVAERLKKEVKQKLAAKGYCKK